jgi:hypothetical protein
MNPTAVGGGECGTALVLAFKPHRSGIVSLKAVESNALDAGGGVE